MAQFRKREHFIPLRKGDLIDRLCGSATPALNDGEERDFRRLSGRLSEYFHLAYHSHFERLKDAYAPFDPDADTLRANSAEKIKRDEWLYELYSQLAWLLERGNFSKLTVDEIHAAMLEATSWGVNLDVAFDAFERLEVYYRGDGIGHRSVRRLRKLFRRETVSFPVFQRLVIIVKQCPHKRHEATADFQNVFIKLFKEIPKADIEMLLPAGRLKMPRMQKGKIGASLLGTIGFVVYKIIAEINKILFAHPLSFYGPLSLVLGYGYRQYYGYQRVRQGYSLQLMRSLYLQSLDNNLGAICRLLDDAEEQECRETILAYFLLWRSGGSRSASELDALAEEWFHRQFGVAIDFETDDALAKLRRLALVEADADRYQAAPPSLGIDRIGNLAGETGTAVQSEWSSKNQEFA